MQSISYSFFGGTPKQQKKVDTVIPEWSQYANITFERVSDAAADAAVRITFDPQSGSWSYVGTVVKTIVNPRITMNLGWIDDSDGLSPDEHGVIMHEWGHTLGLMHEHQVYLISFPGYRNSPYISIHSESRPWRKTTSQRRCGLCVLHGDAEMGQGYGQITDH